MTRLELQKELQRIDRCIEILHEFIRKPSCECIPQFGSYDEDFREKNKVQLAYLIAVKNTLMPLQNKTDIALTEIHHQPVKCY